MGRAWPCFGSRDLPTDAAALQGQRPGPLRLSIPRRLLGVPQHPGLCPGSGSAGEARGLVPQAGGCAPGQAGPVTLMVQARPRRPPASQPRGPARRVGCAVRAGPRPVCALSGPRRSPQAASRDSLGGLLRQAEGAHLVRPSPKDGATPARVRPLKRPKSQDWLGLCAPPAPPALGRTGLVNTLASRALHYACACRGQNLCACTGRMENLVMGPRFSRWLCGRRRGLVG